MFNINYRQDPYSTHQPVLYSAVKAVSNSIVVEFGIGNGSTALLHDVCGENKNSLFSYDNSEDWVNKFKSFENEYHKLKYGADWNKTIEEVGLFGEIGLLFVDQAPWEARHQSIIELGNKANIIILHDADYFVKHFVAYYNCYFTFFKFYEPPKPGPYPESEPPTVIGTNKPEMFDVLQ